MKQTLNLFLLLPLALLVQSSSAQTPGGVGTNLKLWVKSNSGTSTTGGLVDSWTYTNDGTKSFTSSGGSRPTLAPSGLNFYPTVQFSGAQLMDGPTGANAPIAAGDDDYTVFVVWKSNSVTAFQRIWQERGTCGFCNESFAFSTWDNSPPGPGVYGDETGTPPFSHTIQRNYNASQWNISQLNLLNQATNDLEIVDNTNISTVITTLNTDPGGSPNGAALRALDNTVNRMGANFDGTGFLNGDIAEIIVYDRPISGAERASIFSYLAIKYGITAQINLVSSTGTVVWDATANSTYNNAVFGMALDNGSGLSVAQSNSMQTGSGNGAGQSGKANLVISNPQTFSTDQTFLMIGNDNGGLTEVTTNLPAAAAGSKRLGRQWKAQSTGTFGRMTVSIDLNGLAVSGVNPVDFRLMVDEDGNGNFADGPIRYYTAASYTGGVATFNFVTLNNNDIFAFVTSASGSTPLPVSWKSFSGRVLNQTAVLNWEVGNNEAAKQYEIEHSADGTNFDQVGVVMNERNVMNYSFSFPHLVSGNNYFRIRQVDLDGKFVYSRIINIKWSEVMMQLLTNPVRSNYAEVEINVTRPTKVSIEIHSVSGATIISEQRALNTGTNRLKIPMENAATGNYILRLQVDGNILNEKILKL
jgi:hypothetical protein